jgi:uracil-DNA glycosylase family 4
VSPTLPWRRHLDAVTACRRCPRLVDWRERVAVEKVRRFSHETYWGRPVPGFGDTSARLLIVGLAPAAHGANRTGRMFTGDRSGDWLYEALHRYGFANQPTSTDRNDGLRLTDCYITAACRCAPPNNKPTPLEMQHCRPFLEWEAAHLKRVHVVLGLGKIGFESAYEAVRRIGIAEGEKPARPRFSHGAMHRCANGLVLIGSYHPSQQNTFTGRLTRPMFHTIFRRIRSILDRA